MANTEVWKPIPEWEGLYEVSSLGRVRSLDRYIKGRSGQTHYKSYVLQPSYGTGYAHVCMAETGKQRRAQAYVHTLVLTVFVGPRPSGMVACHGPKGPRDNSVENLRWDTLSNNALDRHLFGAPWAPKMKKPPKPPTKVACAVCKQDMFVTKRRNVKTRICGSECLRVWGRICQARKTTSRSESCNGTDGGCVDPGRT